MALNLESLNQASHIIRAGGVVAYPTEACFGLGCDPRHAAALRRIARIKRRSPAKGLLLIADHRARLLPYVDFSAVVELQPILDSWPGPHTWLLPAGRRAGYGLRGAHATVAARVTAHRGAAALCRLARLAVVSTSANRAGRRMLRSADAVRREFGDEIDFIVDGRIGGARAASTIRRFDSDEIVRG